MTDDESAPPADAAPEDAFALVGNETRAAILRALGETPHDDVPFSELRERVGPEMDSGQFNYHLSKLVDRFVDRSDGGYRLRPEGRTLYRTIRAGTFTRQAAVDPFDAGFDCHFCGTPAEATYDDGAFRVRCPDADCGHLYAHTRAPPSAVEAGGETDLLDRIDRYNRHQVLAYAEGVCPLCVNPVTTEFRAPDDVWMDGAERVDAFVVHECTHCGRMHYMTVGLSQVYHPTLIAFFDDRGVDVTATRIWALEFAMTDRYTTVRSTDPWEVALTLDRDGERLELLVDEDLSVDATRS
ncbi:winged helix-turn-helix domain-containing protein [Halosimplex marinum]|uniref:winged helix-turn-helix domain-containing protein n=1 Tax=Halosimplex marinum TaxID=3396620 RepID=UPI003F557676